ncbi:hypothetical protein F5Y17DRAFT_473716 [Xylariaceae sp. FL0594]|nr:hypothetical protein F5Y17DRAFT_473716 [Xylariaceae sp. FL0594]
MTSTSPASAPAPSQELRDNYYYGIESFGALCATTESVCIADPNWKPKQDGTWTVGKRLAVVGRHPITKYMGFHSFPPDQDLARMLVDILKKSGLPWNGFNVLRIGDGDLDGDLPVKMLIQVDRQVDWEAGMRLAHDCRSLMQDKFDLDEVRSRPAPPPRPFWWPAEKVAQYGPMDESLLLTTLLGQCLATAPDAGRGSSGFYLRITTRSKQYNCLFTCSHVVLDKAAKSGINLLSKNSTGDNGIEVIQPACLTELEHELRLILKNEGANIDKWDGRDPGGLTEFYREKDENLKDLLKHCEQRRGNNKIGYVLLAPRATAHLAGDKTSFHRDWAAIDLDMSKFESNTLPKNEICVADLPLSAKLRMSATGQGSSFNGNSFKIAKPNSVSWKITIDHYIDTGSLEDRLKDAKDNGSPLEVFKYGFATQLTQGHLNGIPFVANSSGAYTQSMCIIGFKEPSLPFKDPGTSFNVKGDSGSLVTLLCHHKDKAKGVKAVAAGLLWGGDGGGGLLNRSYVSYATPLGWVLEDVKKCFSESSDDEVVVDNLTLWDG